MLHLYYIELTGFDWWYLLFAESNISINVVALLEFSDSDENALSNIW